MKGGSANACGAPFLQQSIMCCGKVDRPENPVWFFRAIGYDCFVKTAKISTACFTLTWSLMVVCPALAMGQDAPPQVEWFTAHSGSQEESHAHYVMTCADGGYLQIGETGYVGSSAKMFVVKTDVAGNLVWKREIGSGNKNMGNSAIEVEDGYFVCGMLSRNSAVLKLNKSTGATIFQKTHDNGGTDAFEHLALTDNGIVAVGYRNAEDPNNTFFVYGQGHISFLDANGNLLSSNSVNQYLSQAYRIQPSGDGYIIAGGTEDALQYGVIKINASGSVLWSRTFGGNNEDHCFGMDVGEDGSIFLAGHTLSGTANWDTYTMKLSGSGAQLWQRTQGNPRGFNPSYIHDETWGVRATIDGGCIIAAGTGDEYSYSECSGGVCSDQWEAYIVKFGAAGDVQWQETYGSNSGNDWAAEDIDLTSDGGAIVAVDNSQFGFLKLSPFQSDPSSIADLNGDGVVGFADLAQLLSQWGQACNGCAEDLNGDGSVGFQDLSVVLSNWD